MFCEMSPPVTSSVWQLGPDEWQMGSSVRCLKANTSAPTNALTSWQDENKDTFYLLDNKVESPITGLPATNMIYNGGTSSAVWAIAGVIVKAKAWVEGIEAEADTLQYVKEKFAGRIPVPSVVHDWIDKDMNRSFLILRPSKGETLQQAWPCLSDEKRRAVASKIVEYIEILAGATEDTLSSATGCGAYEPYLAPKRPQSEPTWRPIPLPPLTALQTRQYLQPMEIGQKFHFGHADLGPTNIMVTGDGSIQCILDWESAAFYPSIWIATKPKVSYGFILEEVDSDPWAWKNILLAALEERGYLPVADQFSAFQKTKNTPPFFHLEGNPPRWEHS